MSAVGDARKRLSEAETALSRPASPQPTNSTSDALAGAQGVEAIRARMEAATPGPWVSREIARADWIGFDEPAGFFRLYERRSWATPADDAFVAHARTDIPLLLAALDESRAEVAKWERAAGMFARDELTAERDSLAAVVASVRELADAYQRDVDNEQIDGDGAIVLGAVADDLKRLTTPTTTETEES